MELIKLGLLLICAISFATAKPAVIEINDVCDKITEIFNIITGIAPVSVKFTESLEEDLHAAGMLYIDSESRSVTNCSVISRESGLAVVLSFTDRIGLSLPKVNITINNCKAKVHYRVSKSGDDSVSIKVLLAEVVDLGPVVLRDGTDYTIEAESLIRPALFKAFNDFTKQYFSFTINPKDDNSNAEAVDALQLVLKKSMLYLLERVKP